MLIPFSLAKVLLSLFICFETCFLVTGKAVFHVRMCGQSSMLTVINLHALTCMLACNRDSADKMMRLPDICVDNLDPLQAQISNTSIT